MHYEDRDPGDESPTPDPVQTGGGTMPAPGPEVVSEHVITSRIPADPEIIEDSDGAPMPDVSGAAPWHPDETKEQVRARLDYVRDRKGISEAEHEVLTGWLEGRIEIVRKKG